MIDFSECEFINEQMKYYTFIDFCKDCEIIKAQYDTLTKNGKRFAMWYVYANTHMGLKHKNAIWNYLNDYIDKDELYYFIQYYRDKNVK